MEVVHTGDTQMSAPTKLKIAIDLDHTLINHLRNPSAKRSWRLYPSAAKYLKRIQDEFNAEFHLITAREKTEESYLEVKFVVQCIEKEAKVTFSSIMHTHYQPKGVHAHNMNCEYLIDDCEDYISDCRDFTSVFPLWYGVRNQKRVKNLGFSCEGCESWADVYKFLKKRSAEPTNPQCINEL